MKLKAKIAMILILGLVLSLLVNLGVQHQVVYPKFLEIEDSQIEQNIKRIKKSIQGEVKHLARLCKDWAMWDDSFEFVKDSHIGFVQSNLLPNTFSENQLHSIAFISPGGKFVYAKSFKNSKEVNFSFQERLIRFHRNRIFKTKKPKGQPFEGIMAHQDSIYLVVGLPITSSSGEQSSGGSIFMIRQLDRPLKLNLERQMEVGFEMKFQSQSPSDTLILKRMISEEILEAISYIPLINPDHRLMISTSIPTTISERGRESIYSALLTTLGAMFLILYLVHIILGRWVMVPISKVVKMSQNIRETQDYSQSIQYQSEDEVGELVAEFNTLNETISFQLETQQIQNEKLKHMARRDGLTGLYNRRTLDEVLIEEWRRHQREKLPLSIVLLDVDNFKLYNDHYGHPQGDEVLKSIAIKLNEALKRSGDKACRYGGEEFCLILPNTHVEGAKLIAERVREYILDLDIAHQYNAKIGRVSVSLGVCSCLPGAQNSVAELLESADQALLEAKAAGKNCTKVGFRAKDISGEIL